MSALLIGFGFPIPQSLPYSYGISQEAFASPKPASIIVISGECTLSKHKVTTCLIGQGQSWFNLLYTSVTN